MKPLELTVYELRNDGFRGPYYADHPKGHRMYVGEAEHLRKIKHLTNAELMAEYWCEFAEALYWDPKRGRLQPDQAHLLKESKRIMEILGRFASHPHLES